MSDSSPPRNTSTIQSVDRAVEVLELLAHLGASRVTDVAAALGIHKSTAHRLLATLERRGLVEQEVDTARYRLGLGLSQLASSVSADLDLRRITRPVCEQLALRARESVTLDVLEGDEINHVDQIDGSSAVVSVNWLGRRSPLHCTASGKVFLTYSLPSLRERVLTDELKAYTDHTITSSDELDRDLEDTRRRGYSQAVEELEVGLVAVAAPIHYADGMVVAALGISGPLHRLSLERLPQLGQLLVGAAEQASWRLGYREQYAGDGSTAP